MITITMMITAMTSRTTQPPEASAAMSSSTAAAIAFAAATAGFATTLAASVAALAAAFVASAVFLAVSWAVLNGFVRAVIHYGYENKDTGDVLSKADKKDINLLSQNYRDDYEKTKTGGECTDLYLRLLMVTDYIRGMTDTYARTLYRE